MSPDATLQLAALHLCPGQLLQVERKPQGRPVDKRLQLLAMHLWCCCCATSTCAEARGTGVCQDRGKGTPRLLEVTAPD